jgi:hypothetical protein
VGIVDDLRPVHRTFFLERGEDWHERLVNGNDFLLNSCGDLMQLQTRSEESMCSSTVPTGELLLLMTCVLSTEQYLQRDQKRNYEDTRPGRCSRRRRALHSPLSFPSSVAIFGLSLKGILRRTSWYFLPSSLIGIVSTPRRTKRVPNTMTY